MKRIEYVVDEETAKAIRVFTGYTDREYREYIFAEARDEAMRQSLLRQAMMPKKAKSQSAKERA